MVWKKVVTILAALLVLVLLAGFWWLSSYDWNRAKPMIAEQIRTATGRDIEIEGDLHLKIRLAPTLTTGPIKLRNAAWGSEPNMLTTEGLELQVSLLALLRKKGVIKRLVLIKPFVLVEQNADGTTSNWAFDVPPPTESAPPQKASKPFELALEHAEIEDGKLRILNQQTGDAKTLHLGDLKLEEGWGSRPLKIALKGAYNETSFSLEGESDFLHDLLYADRDWAFDWTFKAEQSEVSLVGRLQRPSGEAPPRLEATVKGPQLDVRPWLAESESKPPVAQPKTGRVFSDTPLQLEALNSLDLQAEIDIQELLLPHIALQNVKTTLQIDGGRFEAGPAQAVAGGGNYQAHFSFDARAKPPRMKAELKIDQMNVGMMLKELGRQEVLEGVMDFQADLSAQGNSMADLMGSLNGYTRLVSGQGRIGQLFFGLFTRDVGNQMLKLFNPLEKRESMTPIECMVIRFDSKNGKAELSQMVWVTPETIVVGGGQIDFKTEKIDIGIEPTPKQGSVSLGVLTKPFRLGGTLASPGMNIDPTAAALTAGELVGGVLMGPAGIAVAFSRIQKDVGNPCLEAVKDAENGVVPEKKGFFQKMGDAVRSLGGD
jgi:uncharacterized protein involved in outer membrane biogenesis